MSSNGAPVDQVLTGVRRLLSDPRIYDALQSSLGVDRARKYVCDDIIAANDGDVVLDVGCGTAEILRHLPPGCRYFGFDLSEAYIAAATRRYQGRQNCSFQCADLAAVAADDLPPCHHAIAYGVLHHLSDDVATRVFAGVYERLAPGGHMIAVDPVFVPGQAFIARQLIQRDRGQHVRTPEAYADLVPAQYSAKSVTVRHDLLRVPYSLAITVATKGEQ